MRKIVANVALFVAAVACYMIAPTGPVSQLGQVLYEVYHP